jgi:hypothetical protein
VNDERLQLTHVMLCAFVDSQGRHGATVSARQHGSSLHTAASRPTVIDSLGASRSRNVVRKRDELATRRVLCLDHTATDRQRVCKHSQSLVHGHAHRAVPRREILHTRTCQTCLYTPHMRRAVTTRSTESNQQKWGQ